MSRIVQKRVRSLSEIAMADAAYLGSLRPFMHATFSFDFAALQTKLRNKRRAGHQLSFRTYFLAKLAHFLIERPQLYAMLDKRGRLCYFDRPALFTPLNFKGKQHSEPGFVVLRNADGLQPEEIQEHIKNHEQTGKQPWDKSERFFLRAPEALRKFYYRRLMKRPEAFEQKMGNVFVSFIPRGLKDGFAAPPHPLGFYVLPPEANGGGTVHVCLDHSIIGAYDALRELGAFVRTLENPDA